MTNVELDFTGHQRSSNAQWLKPAYRVIDHGRVPAESLYLIHEILDQNSCLHFDCVVDRIWFACAGRDVS